MVGMPCATRIHPGMSGVSGMSGKDKSRIVIAGIIEVKSATAWVKVLAVAVSQRPLVVFRSNLDSVSACMSSSSIIKTRIWTFLSSTTSQLSGLSIPYFFYGILGGTGHLEFAPLLARQSVESFQHSLLEGERHQRVSATREFIPRDKLWW